MGRRRTKDLDLPPRLYRKGRSYYYVTHERKWLPLGSDRARALRLWAEYECNVSAPTVYSIVERYCDECMDDKAALTKKQYLHYARIIEREWGTVPADDLDVYIILQYRNRPGMSASATNGLMSLLRVAYDEALGWGWARSNPAKAAPFRTPKPRIRYLTDAELRSIREASPNWLAIAIDLAYLTALRPSDLLTLRWDDVGETISLRTQKTKARLAFIITAEVKEALERARARPIVGLFVVATDKGRQITQRRMQEAWRAACEKAGVKDAQYRDIRAKAASDTDYDGGNAQDLLGHLDRRTTEVYLRNRRLKLVQPVRRKL